MVLGLKSLAEQNGASARRGSIIRLDVTTRAIEMMERFGMIAKISLTAAFLLMVAPPIAVSRRFEFRAEGLAGDPVADGIVLAQDNEPAVGTTDNDNDNSNDNDNDSNDSADDNQNADSSQTDQNAAGEEPPAIPPTVLGQPDGEQPEPRQAPMSAYPQPVNPYQ